MIRVVLATVHVDNDGTETVEVMFEDSDGCTGPAMEVGPGGTARVLPDGNPELAGEWRPLSEPTP
jgi:hypothetical protein